MKKLLVIFFLLSSAGKGICEEKRNYIYPFLDKNIVWERNSNCPGWDRAFNEPKNSHILRTRIEFESSAHPDTIITYRGTNHTWNVWNIDANIDDFLFIHDIKH